MKKARQHCHRQRRGRQRRTNAQADPSKVATGAIVCISTSEGATGAQACQVELLKQVFSEIDFEKVNEISLEAGDDNLCSFGLFWRTCFRAA